MIVFVFDPFFAFGSDFDLGSFLKNSLLIDFGSYLGSDFDFRSDCFAFVADFVYDLNPSL